MLSVVQRTTRAVLKYARTLIILVLLDFLSRVWRSTSFCTCCLRNRAWSSEIGLRAIANSYHHSCGDELNQPTFKTLKKRGSSNGSAPYQEAVWQAPQEEAQSRLEHLWRLDPLLAQRVAQIRLD